VDVGAQVSVAGSYLAPEFTPSKDPPPKAPLPPQTIIFVPVQTAVCNSRGVGAPRPVEVADQESVEGSYRPPVPNGGPTNPPVFPPQMIMRVPVQTAVCPTRASGVPSPDDVEFHESLTGSYREPVATATESADSPPQMIISVPVQIAVWYPRAEGVPSPVDVGTQESVAGV
jgi:hypothetical protein